VTVEATRLGVGRHWKNYGLVVRNAKPGTSRFAAEIDAIPARIRNP